MLKNKHIVLLQFIWRHILRAFAKSALMLAVALLFLVAISVLAETIRQGEMEIDRLYETMIVKAELFEADYGMSGYAMNDVIFRRAIDPILASGFVQRAYLEAGFRWTHFIAAESDGTYPDGIRSEKEFNNWNLNPIFAVKDIDEFLVENVNPELSMYRRGHYYDEDRRMHYLEEMPIEIEYEEDFSSFDFNKEFSYTSDSVIPVILPKRIAKDWGVAPGDMGYLEHNFDNSDQPWLIKVHVIGIYSGYIFRESAWESVIMPLDAGEAVLGAYRLPMGFISARFEIDPLKNREIQDFRVILEEATLRQSAGRVPLSFSLTDSELNSAIRQMEQNLALVRLLYPVAIAISLIIAAGFCLLLQLQNAKNASILRALGMLGRQAGFLLVIEQVIITFIGLALGIFVLSLLKNKHIVSMDAILFAGAYLLSSLIGGAAGAILIIKRPVLALLQVKE